MRPYLEERHERMRIQLSIASAFPDHLHPQAEMLYVFKGQAHLRISGQRVSLAPGDLCLCFPGIVHGYLAPENARTLMMIFSPELLPDFVHPLTHSFPQSPVIRREDLPSSVAVCMEEIRREMGGVPDERALRGYLQVILARVIPQLALTSQQPEMPDIAYRIVEYLSVHFTESMALTDLAQALGVSKSHLSHTFSHRLGTNFRTYINTLRADHACALLRDTDLTITEIAYECGFENPRTFNRAFGECYSTTPSAFRQRMIHKKRGENP